MVTRRKAAAEKQPATLTSRYDKVENTQRVQASAEDFNVLFLAVYKVAQKCPTWQNAISRQPTDFLTKLSGFVAEWVFNNLWKFHGNTFILLQELQL